MLILSANLPHQFACWQYDTGCMTQVVLVVTPTSAWFALVQLCSVYSISCDATLQVAFRVSLCIVLCHVFATCVCMPAHQVSVLVHLATYIISLVKLFEIN